MEASVDERREEARPHVQGDAHAPQVALRADARDRTDRWDHVVHLHRQWIRAVKSTAEPKKKRTKQTIKIKEEESRIPFIAPLIAHHFEFNH